MARYYDIILVMDASETTVNVAARLPKSLHKQLKHKAERNVRSLNSELIVAVRYYLTLGVLPEQAAQQQTQEPA